MKFHLTDDGAKPCSAKPGNCPITKETGGEHYNSINEAQTAFENENKEKLFIPSKKKLYAPAKPEIIQPTLEEAEWLIGRVKKLMEQRGSKTPLDVIEAKVAAFGLTGSSLYGLNHPDSDRDVTIMTESPKGTDFHHVFKEDGADVRVTSIFRSAERFTQGIPPDVDLAISGDLGFNKDSPLVPYYSSLGYNKFAYLDKLGSHARADLMNAFDDKKNPKRGAKSLKTAFRNIVISERAITEGNIRTKFNDKEREQFYKSLDGLEKYEREMSAVRDEYDPEEFKEIINDKLLEEARLNVS